MGGAWHINRFCPPCTRIKPLKNTHTDTMKQMLAVLQKMATHTFAYTHTHSQIGLTGQRDHKLTPVVIFPNGLSALTAAMNIAITHTHARVTSGSSDTYLFLDFALSPSSSFLLLSCSACISVSFPLANPAQSPAVAGCHMLLEHGVDGVFFLVSFLSPPPKNEGLADRQVISGQRARADGNVTPSAFASYVTNSNLRFICWMFAWRKHAKQPSRTPNRCRT